MASLVVLKFDTPDGAEKGLDLAQSLQKQQLLQIVDAAIVTWPKGKKKPKTRQVPLGALGALDGAFWGMLIGFIFFVPFFGMALGATMGALGGHFADHGINDDFIKQVRAKVTEGTSGLFLLLGAVTTDKVVEAFKSAPHFELIASNLTHDQENRLKEAFAA